MRILAAFLLALLTIGSAHAQVQKTGQPTPGHAAKWYGNNVIGDAGPAGGSQTLNGNYLTELGITNTGTPLCVTDSLTSAAGGYHQLCFAALTTIGGKTGAFITYNNYGVASADQLYFNVNGTTYSFPYTVGGIVGPVSSTVSDVACWNNTLGSLLYDCGAFPTQNPQSANLVFAGPTSGSAATPTFRALVGADLPNPAASTLGGIQSIAASTSKWIDSISTVGVPHLSQPSYADLSGAPTPAALAGAASGFVNKLRGTTLSQWYGGTSITVGTSLTWTAEGVGCIETGATVTASQLANPLTNPVSYYSLKLLGQTGNTDLKCRFVIESYDSAVLAGQTVTFQIPIQNKTGSPVTPTIATKFPTAQDNWTSSTSDLSAVNMQTCNNTSTCVEAYTFTVGSGATNGYEVVVDFGAVGNTAYVVVGGGFDLRITTSVSTGINNSPPSPEVYTMDRDSAWSKRFFETTYRNGVAPGTITRVGEILLNVATSGGAGGTLGSTWFFKTQKSCIATVTAYSPNSGTINKIYDYTDAGDVGANLLDQSDGSVVWYGVSTSATGNEGVHLTADCRIGGG